MKEFLENMEIGEGKAKLSSEEIKSIIAKNGEIVNTETKKVEDKYKTQFDNQKATIDELNNKIKDLPDSTEVENLKKQIKDYEDKETQRLADEKLAKERSIRDERTNAFFKDIKFASESAKAGVIAQFNAKEFKYDEDTGKFQGATEWLEELKKNDVGAFQSEVANPKFTTNVSTPASGNSMDEVMKAMGLTEEKK